MIDGRRRYAGGLRLVPTQPDECAICGGFGPWRRAGHAEWCDDVRFALARLYAREEGRPLDQLHPATRRKMAKFADALDVDVDDVASSRHLRRLAYRYQNTRERDDVLAELESENS